jgi:type I restriction enzyme M protein
MTQTHSHQKIVQKLWSFCNVLRDDGLSFPEYVEQLTYLLFLKMADEQSKNLGHQIVPEQYSWSSLVERRGRDLQLHYNDILVNLGVMPGTLGLIFYKAENKIKDPSKLQKLVVDLIDKEGWTALSDDVKGAAYEGLLDRTAQDAKSGAGQYFTPRSLVDAIVAVMDPRLGETICDPACGTCGFLLSARTHLFQHMRPKTKNKLNKLRYETFYGTELVDSVGRLGTMNLALHNVGPVGDESRAIISIRDSLASAPEQRHDVVLSNPPFGKKSSMSAGNDGDWDQRNHLPIKTTNKQLNFLQHIMGLLKEGGRAAVVVPDNVLFEGGAASQVRRNLLTQTNLHTILRLPPGIFYAQGVKANVLFFERLRPGESSGDLLWIYDLRTDIHVSLKTRPLSRDDLREFESCFKPGMRSGRSALDAASGRWANTPISPILASEDVRLDVAAIKGRVQRVEETSLQSLWRSSVDDLLSALKTLGHLGKELDPSADLLVDGDARDDLRLFH